MTRKEEEEDLPRSRRGEGEGGGGGGEVRGARELGKDEGGQHPVVEVEDEVVAAVAVVVLVVLPVVRLHRAVSLRKSMLSKRRGRVTRRKKEETRRQDRPRQADVRASAKLHVHHRHARWRWMRRGRASSAGLKWRITMLAKLPSRLTACGVIA